MTLADSPTTFGWIKDIGIPLGGFVLGFFTSRFTMTKKERKEVEQANFENSERLIDEHEAAYVEYTSAISAYCKKDDPAVDDFVAISTAGDRYFYRLNRMAAAILSEKADARLRDDVMLPKLRSAVSRTLPDHYATLKAIATKRDLKFNGELRRSDYESLYAVVEKYLPPGSW